jgi:hypothetical protein
VHTDGVTEPSVESPTADERGAIRAYLQRSEVRLSTIHRVGSALLSGAGLMVLLPAVERDSVTTVLGALLSGDVDLVRVLLSVAVCAAVALPFTALWLLLRDLTQFYFHANHVRHGDGEAFTPRFTLTGLRLPQDELGAASTDELDSIRVEPHVIELLVPANDESRRRIDMQIAAYGGLGAAEPMTDIGRASSIFELAASRGRGLFEEVAKVEHGMARHVLRIQVIVLRYVKAVLAMLTTALTAFALAAVIERHPLVSSGDEAWLAVILLAWAPVAMFAITSPVRWLERLLRSEGATHTAVSEDRELTRLEDVTVRLAIGGFVVAALAFVIVLPRDDLSAESRGWALSAAITAALALIGVLALWIGGSGWRRVVVRDWQTATSLVSRTSSGVSRRS